jgi:hypothetical protein
MLFFTWPLLLVAKPGTCAQNSCGLLSVTCGLLVTPSLATHWGLHDAHLMETGLQNSGL